MKRLTAVIVFLAGIIMIQAQLALKTNIITDAMTTPNIGAEYAVGSRQTVNLVYALNPWSFDSESKGIREAKHWVLMPEYRWWLCSAFNGHFFGVHALAGEFNAANVNLPIPGAFFSGENIGKAVRNSRYDGTFAGVGVTYGYQWILSRHWNLEAEVGVGYGHVWYDKYRCGECGAKLGDGQSNYLGITKIGLSFLYIF